MAGHRGRWTTGAVALTAVLATALAGCTDEEPESAASRAESAASAASSLASQGAQALESATAEAGRMLDDILEDFTEGADVTDDVRLGAPARDADGRTSVRVTVHNTDDSARSFAVQINFEDQDGNLTDTVVVMVDDVQPGKEGTATARSTHDLSGEVRAEVGHAVRY